MSAIARGQITIVDLNDAKTLNLFLSSNRPATQIFNKENTTYAPDYTVSPYLVITPQLFISGAATSQISRIKQAPVWKINDSANLAEFGASAAQTAPYALTIIENLTDTAYLKIECEVIYVDQVTLVETIVKATMTITKTENSGQLICAIAYAPQGTIYKQGVASLKAHCDMWRGSQIDAVDVSYKWYKLVGGGWTQLTAGNNFGCTGYTTNEITIPAEAVLNIATFKCECTDTDPAAGTYNTFVADVISFVDLTDPFQLEISSTTGDKIVNGTGSTTLTVNVWQKGQVIDGSTVDASYTFSWRKFDKDGVADNTWGTSGVKTGRTLVVPASEIDVKATFIVEMTAL